MKRWVSEEKVLELEGSPQVLLKYFGPQLTCSWTRGWWEGGGRVGLVAVESSKKLQGSPNQSWI